MRPSQFVFDKWPVVFFFSKPTIFWSISLFFRFPCFPKQMTELYYISSCMGAVTSLRFPMNPALYRCCQFVLILKVGLWDINYTSNIICAYPLLKSSIQSYSYLGAWPKYKKLRYLRVALIHLMREVQPLVTSHTHKGCPFFFTLFHIRTRKHTPPFIVGDSLKPSLTRVPARYACMHPPSMFLFPFSSDYIASFFIWRHRSTTCKVFICFKWLQLYMMSSRVHGLTEKMTQQNVLWSIL